MTCELLLVLAAGLFGVGLFGALSQQSIVMIMMGLELMVNGIIVAGADVLVLPRARRARRAGGRSWLPWWRWRSRWPWASPSPAIYRARQVDMTDMAEDLKG